MMQLVLLAIFGFIALVAVNPPANAQGHAAAGTCGESGPLPNQIRCFLEAAEAEGDVAICDGAYDFAVRFNCISRFAENSSDPGPCERIPIRNNRLLLMRDSCISGVAAATRLPELCEQVQLDFVRDACFMTQVVEFNATPDLCERITRRDLRDICLTPPANAR
jgi:hypothetical protein